MIMVPSSQRISFCCSSNMRVSWRMKAVVALPRPSTIVAVGSGQPKLDWGSPSVPAGAALAPLSRRQPLQQPGRAPRAAPRRSRLLRRRTRSDLDHCSRLFGCSATSTLVYVRLWTRRGTPRRRKERSRRGRRRFFSFWAAAARRTDAHQGASGEITRRFWDRRVPPDR